jgi:hypothetical protein
MALGELRSQSAISPYEEEEQREPALNLVEGEAYELDGWQILTNRHNIVTIS